jgi:hypothetical protein
MKKLNPAALRDLFVQRATAKFAAHVPDFVALQQLVREQGGTFRNDHGAIRTADLALRDLFARAAGVLGLKRELDYEFPAKKLKSFDLQVPGKDAGQFKVFVSQVDLHAFPKDVAALVREDCAEQAAAMDHGPFEHLIGIAERDHGLSESDAEAFLGHFVDDLMHRNGPPLRRSTLDAVAAVSGEAASALALGPDFNHVTIDVRAAGFKDICPRLAKTVNYPAREHHHRRNEYHYQLPPCRGKARPVVKLKTCHQTYRTHSGKPLCHTDQVPSRAAIRCQKICHTLRIFLRKDRSNRQCPKQPDNYRPVN